MAVKAVAKERARRGIGSFPGVAGLVDGDGWAKTVKTDARVLPVRPVSGSYCEWFAFARPVTDLRATARSRRPMTCPFLKDPYPGCRDMGSDAA
ncbi:hypothetical protein Asru_0369_07 [Acidisphaera rubrifaciens HS-AP3]|uniref:Uncharacterized protein n=1 Tax=Acidisphaera rubrifaciens HS-AP3 TaxID=1231350 RepID=A0A0D6P789_9PROT|nr:hypothetical protein Asru_0369_07 [Acidisphaera rubrifaciens HS-AP3]